MGKEHEKIRRQVHKEYKDKINSLEDKIRQLEGLIAIQQEEIADLKEYKVKYAKVVMLTNMSEKDLSILETMSSLGASNGLLAKVLSELDIVRGLST